MGATQQPNNNIINIENELKINSNSNLNKPITLEEYQEAIRNLNDSSPGHDEISYKMIKNVHPTLINTILALYNLILDSGYFPNSWLLSIIVPIYKKGKIPRETNSYRPISLTCCLCKILEKILNNSIMVQ